MLSQTMTLKTKGRVKVVVHGLTGGIPYSQLPFYSIILQGNNYFIPPNGSMVLVLFMDDSVSNGIVIGVISNKKFPEGLSLYNQGVSAIADITVNSDNMFMKSGKITQEFTSFQGSGNSATFRTSGSLVDIGDDFNIKSPKTTIDSGDVLFNSRTVSTNFSPLSFNSINFLSSRQEGIASIDNAAEQARETQNLVEDYRGNINKYTRLFEGGSKERAGFATLGANGKPSDIYPANDDAVLNNDPIVYTPLEHSPEAAYKERYDYHWGNIQRSGVRSGFDVSTQLSDNFTLVDMTVGNSFPYALQPNVGLQEIDIINNLCYLCNYVLEDINNIFQTMGGVSNNSMRVNSGFRFQQNNSQHNVGQAVDVQYVRNNYVEDYYDEMIKQVAKTINFDQLIVEYSYNKYPTIWLHASYNKDLGYGFQRNEVLTYKSWAGVYAGGILRI